MKKFAAPDGSIISMPEGRVIAYGLSPNEIPFIEKCLPSKDYELYVSDDVRDILAVSCFALIVEADAVNSKDREIITEYYTDLGSNFSETVFWIGYPKPPSCLRTKFRCYENFDELAYILPECLIKAHQRRKRHVCSVGILRIVYGFFLLFVLSLALIRRSWQKHLLYHYASFKEISLLCKLLANG